MTERVGPIWSLVRHNYVANVGPSPVYKTSLSRQRQIFSFLFLINVIGIHIRVSG
jgi:hypothetical protein